MPIAYLFGSQKDAGFAYRAGQEHVSPDQRSDLDLGVVFFRFPERPHRAYMDLYADLADVFDPFNLDLVLLQETGFLFQHEAIQGRVLFCDDGEFLDDYEEMVLKRASDLAFKQASFRHDFFEAMDNGYFQIESDQN